MLYNDGLEIRGSNHTVNCHEHLFSTLPGQGATEVVHGCALGPIVGEFTLSAGGVAHGVHQALPWQCWN